MEDITTVILDNENLIYSIAHKFTKYKNKEDLFQVGCIGMIEAYKNFDPEKNTKFTSYAYQYIYGEMSKFVREDHSLKISRELSSLRSRIEKARIYLTQKYMHYPSIKELSEYLETPEETINMILNYDDPYSMDEILGEDLSMHEVVGQAHDYDTMLAIKCELEALEEPERTIMYERFFNDLTQSEIAYNLGMSQVDISRRERKVLQKLRRTFN